MNQFIPEFNLCFLLSAMLDRLGWGNGLLVTNSSVSDLVFESKKIKFHFNSDYTLQVISNSISKQFTYRKFLEHLSTSPLIDDFFTPGSTLLNLHLNNYSEYAELLEMLLKVNSIKYEIFSPYSYCFELKNNVFEMKIYEGVWSFIGTSCLLFDPVEITKIFI